jgi:hypothetical protein
MGMGASPKTPQPHKLLKQSDANVTVRVYGQQQCSTAIMQQHYHRHKRDSCSLWALQS